MSSTPLSGGRLFVEPLEARIAPTGLLGLANNPADSTDANYLTYNTPARTGHLSFVPASQVDAAITDPSVFALKLSGPAGVTPGDRLLIYNQATGFNQNNPYLQVTAGNMIAFFQDKNHDGEVQTNELVGLAMGKKSGVSVLGTVDGDIATNLANDGTLMLNSVGTPGFKLGNLFVQGNVNGNILSGGDIGDGGSIRVVGTVHNILAGTAANNTAFNFSGTPGQVDGFINTGFYKDGKIGASISNVTINGLVPGGRVLAGDGGLGAVGGSVNTLVVQNDTDAFSVLGGAGGLGNATLKGGVGGAVNNILIEGVANSAANHSILIQAGKGGGNDVFKAGAGGAATGVATSFLGGFDFSTNSGTQSPDLLAQDISVHGGDGGDGFKAGNGGSVTNSTLFGAVPAGNNGVAEIQAVGGHGGTDTAPNASNGFGKGGNGGGVSGVVISNLDTLNEAANSTILVQGGDGGLGKNGGNVSNVTLLGKNLVVTAGNGADSYAAAGLGGSLLDINVTNLPNLFTTQLTLNAGQGGNAGGGNGGSGGSITTVNVTDAAFTALTINGNAHGNGGSSQGALGGAGGTVSAVNIINSEASGLQVPATAAAVAIRSGAGGNGQTGGGSAGSVSGLSLLGTGFSYAVTAGAGGSVNAGGTGDGGAGGGLTSVSISNFLALTDLAFAPALEVGATTAGAGGNGTGAGGAGGALNSVTLNAADSITLQGGNGGTGGSGTAGAGGQVALSGADSLFGNVTLQAGNGGLAGAAPGDGGAISQFITSAGVNIVMQAGNGHVGGVGGAISQSGTSLNQFTNLPNGGNVTIHAGDGSAGNNVAGAGGNVSVFNGEVGLTGSTTLTAGAGGGGTGATKVAAGGSVTQVTLTGANGQAGGAAFVAFDAGNAGVSNVAKRGADGGSVENVVVSGLNAGTIVHHFAAGNASSGKNVGGTGGSVTDIHVGALGDAAADIGIRSGAYFGYSDDASQANAAADPLLSGGIFVGLGGTGGTTSGTNGNVEHITAAAISGIVAGRPTQTATRPGLVTTVDGITLEGSGGNVLRANGDGSFVNFGTANFVGSVYNGGKGPTAAGASTYHAGDGLIAAVGLPTNTSFSLNAFLTLDGNGNRELADLQQPNLIEVTFDPAPANLV